MPTRHRTCEVCETPYHATYSAQRTCGRECGKKIRRPRERQTWPSCRIHVANCQYCGEAFTSRQIRETCSTSCYDRLYNARSRPAEQRRCRGCGVMVADKRREKCDDCRQVDRALRRRADKRRRRALKLGVATERYSLAEIAVRDKFTCGICRGRVDMDAKAPHPKSPSIDHVWPLARGGDDTRANVQLSHWLCNVAKSDQGGGEQLALVG